MTSEPETSEHNQARDRNGRFRPGRSGNPAGKPAGSRNRATRAAEQLLDGQAETLTRKAVELALEGDTIALRLCLDRLLPPRRHRSVDVELPDIGTAGGIIAAMRAVIDAINEGSLTPQEATQLASVIEGARRALETQELERRLEALEVNR